MVNSLMPCGVCIWLILAGTVVPGACGDPCDGGWFYVSYGESAKCYYISKSKRDFGSARDQCIRYKASLASIATTAESDALVDLFRSNQDDERFQQNNYWIGLWMSNRTPPWQWLDGSEYEWQNWDDGEPDRHDVCARAVYSDKLQWRGTACANEYRRICEKAPKNATTTPTIPTQVQTTTIQTTAAAIASTIESPTTTTTRTTTQTTTTPETTTQIPDTVATAITEGSTTATSKPTTGTPTAASPTSSTAKPQSTPTETESTETATRTTPTPTPTSHSSSASSSVTQNTTGAAPHDDGDPNDDESIDKVLIGVVVGVVVLCVIVIAIIVFLVLKPIRRNQSQSSDEEAKPQPTENQFDGPTEESETRVAAETTEVEDETQIDAGRPLYENSQFLAKTTEVEDETQIDAGGSNGPLYENTQFLPMQSNGKVETPRDSPSPTGQEKTEDTKKTTEEEDIEALYAKPIKRAKPKN